LGRGRLGWRCCGDRWRRSGFWRGRSGDGRWSDDGGWAWRCGFGCSLCLLALENRFEGVARFRDFGKVELWLVVDGLSGRSTALAAVLEVVPDPFGLVGFDGAGMGLSGNADCFERIQNWPALDFQFSCQIVDSNFAHPSLFVFAPLRA
jgi:hypothetical protein